MRENLAHIQMTKYILRRFLINIPVLLGITLMVFLMIEAAPGDPLVALFNPEAGMDEQAMQAMRARFNLDKPLPVRYIIWLTEAVQGNLGFRTKDLTPVSEVVSRRIGPTLLLMGSGLLLGCLIGIPLGVVSALRQYSFLDFSMTGLAFLGISLPVFFSGLGGLYLFALKLRLFPVGGMATTGQERTLLDILYHLILPSLILGFNYIAIFLRYTRSSMLEVIRMDYVTTARAKGLQEMRVIIIHALRNALLPLITVIGLSLPSLFVGAVFIETIFTWPGMGTLFIDGVNSRDFPLIMGIILITATAVLLANLLTDVVYALIDPRIRYES